MKTCDFLRDAPSESQGCDFLGAGTCDFLGDTPVTIKGHIKNKLMINIKRINIKIKAEQVQPKKFNFSTGKERSLR